MKRIISLFIALSVTVAAFAQDNLLRQRMELASIEVNDGEVELQVFQMEDNGRYYLSVGHLGIGDDIFQINFDPLFELFIPLGETLSEAIETLDMLKDFYDESSGTTMEMNGCLCLAFPDDKWETVKVTTRRFLFSKLLEFSLERDGYIRATHIGKSDFKGLVSSTKLYRKIHPNEP